MINFNFSTWITHFSYKVTHFCRLSKVVQSMILHMLLILKSKILVFGEVTFSFCAKTAELWLGRKGFFIRLLLLYVIAKFNFKLICRLRNIIASKFIVILYVIF